MDFEYHVEALALAGGHIGLGPSYFEPCGHTNGKSFAEEMGCPAIER